MLNALAVLVSVATHPTPLEYLMYIGVELLSLLGKRVNGWGHTAPFASLTAVLILSAHLSLSSSLPCVAGASVVHNVLQPDMV